MAKKYKKLPMSNTEPGPIMGKGDFANMPVKPKFMTFKNEVDLRGGLPNSFTCALEEVSGISENEQADY